MKPLMLALLLVPAALAGGSKPAAAEVNYPWCLVLGSNDGSWNCGFASREQCMQARVTNDLCVPNPLFSSAARPTR
jgi:hypothetical protein